MLEVYKARYHFAVNFYSIFLLITFIPDFIGIDSMLLRYAFWGLKAGLALWIIYKTKGILSNLSGAEVWFFVLLFMYAANIYIDVFLFPLPILDHSQGVLDFAQFCLIFFLAISFRYHPSFHSKQSFNFFFITLTAGLILAYFFAIENLKLDTTNIRYDANSTVNSIGYGQAGCALCIISLYGIINQKINYLRVLFIITMILGMISIAKAGSRSPVVVLAFVGAFYFLARLGVVKGIMLMLVLLGLMIVYLDSIIDLMESMGSTLAVRLTSMVEEGESSGRDQIYKHAWSIISDSPILGSYYVIPYGLSGGSYPHNFFLEVFLANGIIGGVPYMILVFFSLFRGYTMLRKQHGASWIILLYLQMVCFGMFSTALYSSQDFWILLFFLLSIPDFDSKTQMENSLHHG